MARINIKTRYYELETKVNTSNNAAYKSALSDIKKRLDTVLANKNVMEAEELKDRMSSLFLLEISEKPTPSPSTPSASDKWICLVLESNRSSTLFKSTS